MKSMGEVIKTLMPELISVSEIGRYTCDGCKNEVVVIQSPIVAGPEKGKLIDYKRGCVCWENEQAREAKREQRQLQVKKMFDKYSTVSPDLEKASFENFNMDNSTLEQAFKLSVEYANEFSLDNPKNLLFAGMYGLGKSHLSYSICQALKKEDLYRCSSRYLSC